MANNPPLYNKNVQSGHATIPDSIDDMLQPRYLHQQAPLGISQYYTSPTYRPLATMDVQKYATPLTQKRH
jgi:hypothetical protein